jgi:hypothetical protein
MSRYWLFVYVNPNGNDVAVELDYVAYAWGDLLKPGALSEGYHVFPIAHGEFDGAGLA